jgi:pyruvate/2-oxoglutarate dehydrogenase complex dihydrolipoamide acyltransferase (E2) component
MEDGVHPRVREAARLSPVQRITIGNLRRGQKEGVPVSLFADADAGELLAARERHGVTVTAVLAFLLARTLSDQPALNAAVVEDKLVRYADVNLGIAVALDDGGLVVPVLPRAQERTLADVASSVSRVAARARAGELELADVRHGTFTLSSAGMLGPPVHGTPLIPHGQAGILLAGGIADRPVVRDGAVVPGRVLPLSLTFDHAVAAGAPAMAFLGELIARIEHVGSWLP